MIIAVTKSDDFLHRCMCPRCDSTLEFSDYDIGTYSTVTEGDIVWHSYIPCPGCRNQIILNTVH